MILYNNDKKCIPSYKLVKKQRRIPDILLNRRFVFTLHFQISKFNTVLFQM